MPTCKKCGLENAPFGKNKNTYNGLSVWCKMCMAETRIKGYEKTDWAAVNKARRANPEYRDKERKRANQLDHLRRLTDKNYVERRLQDHYRYLERSGTEKERREKYNKKRREQRAAKKLLDDS